MNNKLLFYIGLYFDRYTNHLDIENNCLIIPLLLFIHPDCLKYDNEVDIIVDDVSAQ